MTADRFAEHYRGARPEDLPWFSQEPDADLMAWIAEVLPEPARVLDLGAGPAVHSIAMAARGHEVVAVDGVADARDMALGLAKARGVEIDYRVGDALAFHDDAPFDLVFDRGFLHTLGAADCPRWRAVVAGALRPGGSVLTKCFDIRPARDYGPVGMRPEDILDALGPREPGGLWLERMRRSRFPNHDAQDHATWTVLARRE